VLYTPASLALPTVSNTLAEAAAFAAKAYHVAFLNSTASDKRTGVRR